MTAETFWHIVDLALVLFGGTLAGLVSLLLIQTLIESITYSIKQRRQRRIARIEAELDAKQEQLRRTILSLAQQLAAERDETSRQMARAAFLTSGKTPPTR